MNYNKFLFTFLAVTSMAVSAGASGNVARVLSVPAHDLAYEYMDPRTGEMIQRSPLETARFIQARKDKQAAIQAASDAKNKFEIRAPWKSTLRAVAAPLAVGAIALGFNEDASAALSIRSSGARLGEDTAAQKEADDISFIVEENQK